MRAVFKSTVYRLVKRSRPPLPPSIKGRPSHRHGPHPQMDVCSVIGRLNTLKRVALSLPPPLPLPAILNPGLIHSHVDYPGEFFYLPHFIPETHGRHFNGCTFIVCQIFKCGSVYVRPCVCVPACIRVSVCVCACLHQSECVCVCAPQGRRAPRQWASRILHVNL